MSSSSSRAPALPTLPPFRAAHFSLWKMKCLALFLAHGLQDVVETPVAVPLIEAERGRAVAAKNERVDAASVPADAAALGASQGISKEDKEVMQQSRRAYGALVSALGANELRLCQHVLAGDAHGVWSVLLATFERKSVASKVQLIEKLFTMQMTRGESVSLYVARLSELKRSLEEQDERITPAILLHVLLRGLPAKFGTLVTLLKMKDALTFDEAVEACKSEEERHCMDEERQVEEVHLARAKQQGESRSSGTPLRCFTCDQTGHIKYHCPKNAGKKKCERCHRVGHSAQECRTGTSRSGRDTEEEEQAATMEVQESDDDDEWS